jgi:hypothetical protein
MDIVTYFAVVLLLALVSTLAFQPFMTKFVQFGTRKPTLHDRFWFSVLLFFHACLAWLVILFVSALLLAVWRALFFRVAQLIK